MKLQEKVSIITGGGRGIGRVIANTFASEGSAILIAGRDEESIRGVAGSINKGGGRAIAVATDVSDEQSIARMVGEANREFGQIDILINNAGVIGPTALVTNINRRDWDEVLAVNLTGAFLCSKHVLPYMIERQRGSIINITSVAGLMAYALRSPYAVSKWGMIGLTRTLAEEAGRHNITVNAIAPGPVRGPRMTEVIRRRAAEMGRPPEEIERDYIEPTALKRMVEESDIAAMALFLVSDEGRSITGETINISGGYRL